MRRAYNGWKRCLLIINEERRRPMAFCDSGTTCSSVINGDKPSANVSIYLGGPSNESISNGPSTRDEMTVARHVRKLLCYIRRGWAARLSVPKAGLVAVGMRSAGETVMHREIKPKQNLSRAPGISFYAERAY